MLLEVALYGINLPHEEVIRRVEWALGTQFASEPFASVDVECIEHAGEDAASG